MLMIDQAMDRYYRRCMNGEQCCGPLDDGPWMRPPDVVARRIRGELLLVPIRRSSNELDGFFALNPVAADIWNWASEGALLPEIVSRLSSDYAVSEELAFRDATQIISELITVGALVPRPSTGS